MQHSLQVISRSDHPVTRKKMSPSALKVLYRLSNSGYRACLVGGAVRDLLLGITPKDFDIATDAKPEQVKALFRNSRLIGRRFRLAHILFGREVVEVATFRGHHDDGTAHGVKEDGRIIRDNVYGSIEEDALRRDFTINALFYDISTYEIFDYCHAMDDIANRQLRLIGDPVTRYKEDPVRMLRAVRLAVKLDLTIAPTTAAPINDMADLLKDMPGGRLWDESHKLFLAGHGKTTFHEMEKYGLINTLLPLTQQAIEQQPKCQPLIDSALANTDQRKREDKPINPAFLYACFLWWPVLIQKQAYMDDGYSPAEAMQRSVAKVISEQVSLISIPKRFTQFIREVWLLQHRLVSRRGKNLSDLLEHSRFRAAYDFLLLRTATGELNDEAAKWWTEVQEVTDEERLAMFKSRGPNKGRRRRPRKRKHDS